MDCVFCKIVSGEIPAIKVYEDDRCVVILDKFPVTRGQSLVISKSHEPYVFDLEDDLYQHVFSVAKRVAKASDKALDSMKSWLAVQGMDVDHSHIKIYPVFEGEIFSLDEGIGKEASDEELEDIGKRIRQFL